MNLELLRSQYALPIRALASRYGMEKVRIFGSVARGEEKPASDIDFLVHVRPNTSLLALAAFDRELARLLGVRVDVVPDDAIDEDIKDTILHDAVALWDEE